MFLLSDSVVVCVMVRGGWDREVWRPLSSPSYSNRGLAELANTPRSASALTARLPALTLLSRSAVSDPVPPDLISEAFAFHRVCACPRMLILHARRWALPGY